MEDSSDRMPDEIELEVIHLLNPLTQLSLFPEQNRAEHGLQSTNPCTADFVGGSQEKEATERKCSLHRRRGDHQSGYDI